MVLASDGSSRKDQGNGFPLVRSLWLDVVRRLSQEWIERMANASDIPRTESLPSFRVMCGIRTVSAANAREHWADKAKRNKSERTAIRAYFSTCPPSLRSTDAPLVVSLCRFGKRLLDDDNLAGSFKAIRDEVAACLNRDDGPKAGIRWVYQQTTAKDYWIEIEVKADETDS
jgi:hypothetical protein